MRPVDSDKIFSPDPGQVEPAYAQEPVVIMEKAGLKYPTGNRRSLENLQSRVFNLFRKGRQKKYFWALDQIDFRGYAEDIVGVIGRNGAGKSTFCRLIANVLKPDSGRVHVNGKVSALLALGTGFNYQLSGRDNVYLNGMMLGFTRSQIDTIFDEIVDFSGIGRFINEPLKNYSIGMRARLAFSIGAMIEPEVLILDEALSAGDIAFAEKAGRKLQEVIRNSKIVIVVTHNLEFVEKYCTKALWIDQGKVREYGDPLKIVQAYRGPYKDRKPIPTIELLRPRNVISEQVVVNVEKLGISFPVHDRTGQERKKKSFWPLKQVDFKVKKGDVVGIVGRNGAGKTTLCRVLSGILKPDKGHVFVDGETTALLSFGTGFNIQLTGRENILLNGLMLGMSRKQLTHLSKDIIDFSELGSIIDQPVKQYSSGMLAKLGFSIAATIKPDIFIIDEALNAGDISFYKKASDKIQELLEEAKAVIVVTHSMPFVNQVCNRGLWLENGVIEFDGQARQAVSAYVNHMRQNR